MMYYYTQAIGDATNLPTIKGANNFYGLGLFDADPYLLGGANWFSMCLLVLDDGVQRR